jgi:hypothetical protein
MVHHTAQRGSIICKLTYDFLYDDYVNPEIECLLHLRLWLTRASEF